MNEIHSFLLMGQSNMAGRGYIGEVPPIMHPRCHMLRNGRWQPMHEPINPDRPIFEGTFRSGISLAASFAAGYADSYNADAGLIPCADGGTSIVEWMPGELLFDHALSEAKFAMRTSRLTALLWHQGEQDASPERISGYKEKLETMFTSFREAAGLPDLPIVMGELSALTPAHPREEVDCALEMNRLFREVAIEVPRCILVPAADLPLQKDNIHFSAPSLRTLGLRYLEGLGTLLESIE